MTPASALRGGMASAALRSMALVVTITAAGCGGPLISNFNNAADGEKGQHFEADPSYDPSHGDHVLVVSPFASGPRGPIICCGKDARTFAAKLADVTGWDVELAELPNGAQVDDYRRLLTGGDPVRFARAVGHPASSFDLVVFGDVVEHEGFLRIVHGYSADITMSVQAFGPDGARRFEAWSRVQYPADTMARESAKVIAELAVGRR